MKKRMLALLLVMAMVLQGMSTIPAYAAMDEPVEYAEEWMETAIPLTKGEEVEVSLADGAKYYSFTPEKDGIYIFDSFEHNGVDIYGELYDADGVCISEDDDGAGEGAFRIEYVLEAGKTYYVKVRLFDENNSSEDACCKIVIRQESYIKAAESEVKVLYGETANLEVLVSEDYEAADFQWYYWGEEDIEGFPYWNYIEITGATDKVYTVSGTPELPTEYCCIVSIGGEEEARVSFTTTLDTGMYIGEPETKMFIEEGKEVCMSVEETTGVGDVRYQWFYLRIDNETGETFWDYITEATGTALSYESTDDLPSLQFRCEATDDYLTVGREFVLIYNTELSIEDYESNISAGLGDEIELSISPSAAMGELKCQWYYYDESNDEDVIIDDADEFTYNVVVENAQINTYVCKVWTEVNGVKQEELEARFYLQINSNIILEREEEHIFIELGSELPTLQVNVLEPVNVSRLTFEWYACDPAIDEMVLIPDASSEELPLSMENLSSTYYCKVSNGDIEVFEWFYISTDSDLSLLEDYVSVELDIRETETLTVEAIGGFGALNYQWYYYDEKTDETVAIEGATNSSFTISKEILDSFSIYKYIQLKCEVTDSMEKESCYFYISYDTGLMIGASSVDITAEMNEEVRLQVNAVGGIGELTYTWYCQIRDENDDVENLLIEGHNSSYYDIVVNNPNIVCYICNVSDGIVEKECYFSIEIDSGLEAKAKKDEITVLAGQPVELEVIATATNGAEITYEWYYWEGEDKVYFDCSSNICVLTEINANTYYCKVSDGIATKVIYFNVNEINLQEGDFVFGQPYYIGRDEGVCEYYRVVLDENALYRFYSESEDADPYIKIYDENLNKISHHDDDNDWEVDFEYTFKKDTVYYIELATYGGYTTFNTEKIEKFAASAVGDTNISVKCNDSATLAVVVLGNNPTYQWYALKDEKLVPIENATEDSYVLNVTKENLGTIASEYVCKVKDGEEEGEVRFYISIYTIELKTEDHDELIIKPGQTKEVTVEAETSIEGATLSYQWCWVDARGNFIPLEGETNSTISITADDTLMDYYVCEITDGYSREVYYLNVELDSGLLVYGDSQNITMSYGDTKELKVVATSENGVLHYQWKKLVYDEPGNEDSDWEYYDIEGATSDTYTLFADENASTRYACQVTDGITSVWKTFYISYTGEIIDITNNAEVTFPSASLTYTGAVQTPEPVVKVNSQILEKDVHYTLEYANNINVGVATVTVKGIGKYKGIATANFTIVKASLNKATVKLAQNSYTYDGLAKTPAVTVTLGGKTLVSGTDYTVKYTNNTSVGTATVTVTGNGNCTGTAIATYKIVAATIAKENVTINPTSFDYNGAAQNATVVVKVGGATLKANTDYAVAIKDNVNKGTATVTVTGKGNYAGTVTATYTIKAASIANAKVTVKDVNYQGKAVKPAVTVKVGSKTLKSGTDYTVKYSKNDKIGTATVTITGKGNYTGTKKATFKVKKGATVTVGAYKYKITGNDTVAFAGIKSTKTTKVTIADTVKINGKKFKVTSIADKALYKKTKVTSVTIGKNVTTIGKSAFEGAKKLKTITVKATKIKSVGKNALKGIHSKATIKVPSKQYSTYSKKIFKSKGQGKKVKIKK